MINLQEWKDDPAKAAGELVPAIVIAVATGGAGAGEAVFSDAADELGVAADDFNAVGEHGLADSLRSAEDAQRQRAGTFDSLHEASKQIGRVQNAQGVVQAAAGSREDHTADGYALGWGAEKAGMKLGKVVIPMVVAR
jgi:hypothetical protein